MCISTYCLVQIFHAYPQVYQQLAVWATTTNNMIEKGGGGKKSIYHRAADGSVAVMEWWGKPRWRYTHRSVMANSGTENLETHTGCISL